MKNLGPNKCLPIAIMSHHWLFILSWIHYFLIYKENGRHSLKQSKLSLNSSLVSCKSSYGGKWYKFKCRKDYHLWMNNSKKQRWNILLRIVSFFKECKLLEIRGILWSFVLFCICLITIILVLASLSRLLMFTSMKFLIWAG